MNRCSATIVIMTGFAILGVAKAPEPEDIAIATIVRAGGRIKRDDGQSDRPVIHVSLPRSMMTEAVLKELTAFKHLKQLALTGATDATLHQVASVSQLENLLLFQALVTDAGLKNLAGLKHLKSLYLESFMVTDAGMKDLRCLGDLQILNLSCMQVTDKGVAELSALRNLMILGLHAGNITDKGLRHLSSLKNLEWLALAGAKVTDAGLKELAGLDQLLYIGLSKTKVTNAGLNELKKTLPDCQVEVLQRTSDTRRFVIESLGGEADGQ